jgi:hypothetical protein
MGTIHLMKTGYAYKRQWRQQRYDQLLAGRQKQTEKQQRREKERGKNDIMGANAGKVAGDFQEDNQTIADINAVGKELGGDNDLVTLDSLLSTREEIRQRHRDPMHMRSHSLAPESSQQLVAPMGGGGSQSLDSFDDGSLLQLSQITGPGQSLYLPAGHVTVEQPMPVHHHYAHSHHPVDPFKREKIVGALPVRSLALNTRLADGPKEVRLIHDEREFVLSLSESEKMQLKQRGKIVPLPPVVSKYRRRLSEATPHTNGRNFVHVKEMFPSNRTQQSSSGEKS